MFSTKRSIKPNYELNFFSELIVGLIAILDSITPRKIIFTLIFLQPLFEFTKSAELNIVRHLSQRLIVLWLLVFFIWRIFRDNNIKLHKFGIESSLLIYVLSAFISVIFASQIIAIDTTKVISSLLTLPILIILGYLIPAYLDETNDHPLVFRTLVLSLALVTIFGLIQFLVYSMIYPMGFRLSSVFHDPNIFSRFILIGFSFIFTHLVICKNPVIPRPILIFIMFLSLVCLLLTYSRSGYATLFIVLGLFYLIYGTKKQRLYVIPVIIILGIIAFIFLFSQRTFVGSEFIEESSFNRIQLLLAGIDMIENHWMFGIGYTNFSFFYTENYVVSVFQMSLYDYEMMGYAVSIHNWFVEVWAEQGIIGLLAYVYFFYRLIKAIRYEIKMTRDDTLKSFLIGSNLMVFVFLLHGFLYHTFISQFFFWSMLGITLFFITASKKRRNEL